MVRIRTETIALAWPARNALIEASVREYLGRIDSGAPPLSTIELARGIAEGLDDKEIGKLAGFLTRLGPHLSRFASHDGETTTRFNKTQTRWRWWGQAITGAGNGH